MDTYILAIDPSCNESAFVLFEENTLRPIDMGFLPQDDMLNYLNKLIEKFDTEVKLKLAVETIQFLGGTAGSTVFRTCILVGRILERASLSGIYSDIKEIYRKEEKINLCGTMRANDKRIKDALVSRFAKGVQNIGKGTKKNPGWFYGFKKDLWQAYAVGITYYDLYVIGRRYFNK